MTSVICNLTIYHLINVTNIRQIQASNVKQSVRFKLHTYLCQTSFFFDSRLKQKRWAHSMRNIASNNHFPFPLFWHVWDDRFLGQLPPIDRKIGRVDMTWFRAVGAKVLLKNKRKKLTSRSNLFISFYFMEELRYLSNHNLLSRLSDLYFPPSDFQTFLRPCGFVRRSEQSQRKAGEKKGKLRSFASNPKEVNKESFDFAKVDLCTLRFLL